MIDKKNYKTVQEYFEAQPEKTRKVLKQLKEII